MASQQQPKSTDSGSALLGSPPIVVSIDAVGPDKVNLRDSKERVEVGYYCIGKPEVETTDDTEEHAQCRNCFRCGGHFRNGNSVLRLFLTDYFLLSVFDSMVISGLIIGPLTVFFWRGTWTFLDHQLFPNDQAASGWICLAVGNVGLLIIVHVVDKLEHLLEWPRHQGIVQRVTDWHWMIGYHLYSYVVGVLNVCHWRGLWILLDHYTGINPLSSWVSVAVGK